MALTPTSVNTQENELLTIITSQINQLNTAMPVEVVGVDTQQHTVRLKPLLAMLDNASQAVPYGILSNVPYLRLQAGAYGIICDPKIGDKGVAVFCSRDISNVRHSTLPASHRQYSISDAVYVALLLYEDPKTYLKIEDETITVQCQHFTANSHDATLATVGTLSVRADTLEITAKITIQGDVTISGNATIGGISFKDHVHGNGNQRENTTPPKG